MKRLNEYKKRQPGRISEDLLRVAKKMKCTTDDTMSAGAAWASVRQIVASTGGRTVEATSKIAAAVSDALDHTHPERGSISSMGFLRKSTLPRVMLHA